MIRWVAVIFIALVLLPALLPMMQKIGVWRLPGDVRFTFRRTVLCLPFGSTLIVSALAFLIAQLLQ